MYRFALSVLAFSGLLVALGPPPVAAQTGLESLFRQLGERAIEEIVRPGPPPLPAPSTRKRSGEPRRGDAPAGPAGPPRAEVLEAQRILVRLGYNPGVPDGLMGPNTARAISAFQADAGRPQTGAVTNALIGRLRSAAANPAGARSTAQPLARPSFDCARASTPTEFAICGTPGLARLDRQMAVAFATARAAAANPSAVVTAQRNWISRRNACRSDVGCLRSSMQRRLAELGGQAVPARPSDLRVTDFAPSRAGLANRPDALTARNGASGQTASIRDDGIRVHPNGRLIVPYPVRSANSPDGQQLQALAKYLRHAAIAKQIESLTPAENPGFFADIARDYLTPAEVHPFFCELYEMTPDAANCMNSADASFVYMAAGGRMNRTGERAYLWWRGASEFERRRNMQSFAESGLLEKVIAAAPEMPVRLIYQVEGSLERYDFDADHFPFAVSGGPRPVEVPGSHSKAFDLAKLVQPVAVPPAAAQPLLQQISKGESGRSELTMGVAVDITLEDPGHEGQLPRWQSEVVSSAYFLDEGTTQPLADLIAMLVHDGGSAQPAASDTAPRGGLGTQGDMTADVMRTFDLLREDGRIVIDFEGYGEPTFSGRQAIFYLFASAARDYVDFAAGDLARHTFPVLFSIVSDGVRSSIFDCSTVKECFNRETGSFFAGENEFQARQAQTAYEQDIVPRLVAKAPAPPIPMRIYLDARLSAYNFDDENFGLSIFQQLAPDIEPLRRMFSFEPIFSFVPDHIPMPPDAAEALVNETQGNPVLRLDIDLLHFGKLGGLQTVMTVRPVAVALVSGATRQTVHYEETYDTPDDPAARRAAAEAFLGPEMPEQRRVEVPTAYDVMGVAPGMTAEAAQAGLLRTFDNRDISVEEGILRAERGYCTYRGISEEGITDAMGSICLLARLKDQHVSRVSLRRIVHPGEVHPLIDETRARLGEPASRGDGDVPDGAMSREYFGWGAELETVRAMLGRPEIALPVHELEVDHIYVDPRTAVVTHRVDAPLTAGYPRAGGGETGAASQMEVPPASAAEPQGERSDADRAAPDTADNKSEDAEIALLGIAPGMARAGARAILEKRFGRAALSQADDGTLIAESGPCRYAAATDPAIEAEAGSNCVVVAFGPEDAVSNIVLRYVVAGSHLDTYAAQLEGRFGAPVSRARSEQAPDTLILGWGPELEATAAELERDGSAGQTLHALEARLTQANGVTLATARLDTDPVLSSSAATEEGDAGSAPPPIDF